MMHKAWSSIEEVPYCFWRSFVKFQGHTVLKSIAFDPNWAFPGCNFSLKRCPIVFQGHPSNFKVTRDNKSPILTRIECFWTVTLVWIHRWLWNDAQSLKQHRIGALLLYPPYPKDRGMLWFYAEAARRPQWCYRDNSKTTGWIVLKFGIHIGSDSVLTWLTFQGRRSKVKVTASENDVIFSTFLNFHFLSHFPPKPSWGGHSNTPQQ